MTVDIDRHWRNERFAIALADLNIDAPHDKDSGLVAAVRLRGPGDRSAVLDGSALIGARRSRWCDLGQRIGSGMGGTRSDANGVLGRAVRLDTPPRRRLHWRKHPLLFECCRALVDMRCGAT